MKKILLNIYGALLNSYGPQGWWPLSGINRPVRKNDEDLPFYEKALEGKRTVRNFKKNWPRHLGIPPRNGRDMFEIITGAILTQNTSWTNVEKSLYNLNKTGNNTIRKIRKISKEELAELIKSSRYQNQKGERLKYIAEYFKDEETLEKFFKSSQEEVGNKLISLKGIGPETRDSITLYAGGLPVFVIDAYTKRIFSRILNLDNNQSYDYWQSIFMENLSSAENKVNFFKEYHGLIVKHAQEYCRPKPLCDSCFLKECIYGEK